MATTTRPQTRTINMASAPEEPVPEPVTHIQLDRVFQCEWTSLFL